MNSDQDFKLGFSVDTSGLLSAKTAAREAAAEVSKLGDSEEAMARKAKEASDAAAKLTAQLEAERRAAAETARQQKLLDEALAKGRISAEQHTQASRTLTEEHRRQAAAAAQAQQAQLGVSNQMQVLSGTLRVGQRDLVALSQALRGQSGVVGGLETLAAMGPRVTSAVGPVGVAAAGVAVGVGAISAAVYKGSMFLGEYQDRFALLEGRLRNALGSTTAARSAMDALHESTQRTGLGFQAASDAMARIGRNNASIGLTQAQMLQMVDTVQKLGAASGASAGEMAGGMVQFGQALASGRLQGDELRSIMENFPALAKAIAENFELVDGTIGVSIGTLRRMGSEGELTGAKVAEAVLRATQKANEEFARMPTTIAQANQKVSDNWDLMLAEMGKAFNASQFGQWMLGGVNTLAGGLAEAAQRVNRGQVSGAEFSKQFGFINEQLRLDPYNRDLLSQRDQLVERFRATTAAGEQARVQEQIELTQSLAAKGQQGIDATNELKTIAERVKSAQAQVKQIENSLALTRQAIAKGGTQEYTVEDLRANEQILLSRLPIAQQNVASIQSQLGTAQLAASDAARARALGGLGGQGIVSRAITAQRADVKAGAGADLEAYIGQFVRDEVAQGAGRIEQMTRAAVQATNMAATIGKGQLVVREAEIANEMAGERLRFGNLAGRPDVLKWLAQYEAALRRSKEAADAAADSQRVYQANQQAIMARAIRAAGGNPRRIAEVQLEEEIRQGRLGFAESAQADQWELARRAAFSSNRNTGEDEAARQHKVAVAALADEQRLVGLSNRDYAIQVEVLRKKQELQRQGYEDGEEFYRLEVDRAAQLAAMRVDQQAETRAKQQFFDIMDDGVYGFERNFKGALDSIFEYGLEAGGKRFMSGMSDIARQIGADLTYELAVRPFEEMLRELARVAALKLVRMFFGGGGGGDDASLGVGYNQALAARGAWFDGMTSNFANGGVVSGRTAFSFGGGRAGMMGEASPEAIMPLRRDSSGRLGVMAGGGGDVSVVVQDMRGASAPEIQTKQGRGPDGRRMIQLLVRDQMKSNIRSGEMDSTMRDTYGAGRTLTRR